MLEYKTYRGKSLTEALTKMKLDLGPNALIIKQREVKPSGIFKFFKEPEIEIVCVKSNKNRNTQNFDAEIIKEKEREEQTYRFDYSLLQKELSEIKKRLEILTSEKKVVTTDIQIDEKYGKFQKFFNVLKEHDIGEDIIEKIFESIEKETNTNLLEDEKIIKEKIRKKLMDLIETTGPLNISRKSNRIFMFVGPTGMGKTTTLVKIGANYKLKENKELEIITLDNYRIGASQQLKSYCEIMQVPYKKISDKKELKNVIKKSKADLILIDTAGRSHYDDISISMLTDYIKELSMHNLDVFLVISANTKKRDILEITEKYSKTNYKYLLYTKLDETYSTGAIIDATYRVKKPISYVTFGQDVPKHIEIATPEYIVNYIMKEL